MSCDTLSDFTRDRRILRLAAMAAFIGVLAAFVAAALLALIGGISNLVFFGKLSASMRPVWQNHLGAWVILAPALGGLVIGLMARYGSDKIRGHGIPEALEAILFGRSRMSLKVALLKPLSSALSIGTGGPFGAEGPIIMTGGAFGSLFAQLFELSAAERKTLLVAGAAAGMAAVFATPMAAVLLAVELLLFEWRPRSFIPVALAAVVASACRVPLLGSGPLFPVTPHAPPGAQELLLAAWLGLLAGFASAGLTRLVYFWEDAFGRLKLHWMWWPALGGLVVGIGGWLDPRVLSVGYDTIGQLLRGQLLGASLLGLMIGKAVVWAVALGSGTSGGVLAPLLIMGGSLGAVFAYCVPVGDPGLWATLGMAAIMGGTMRSPLTATVFALELTEDIHLLAALLLACTVAQGVTVLVMRRSILTEKVARRGRHVAREYCVDPLALVRVGEVMETEPPTVRAGQTVEEALREPVLGGRQAALVLDEEGRLAGIVTRGDLVRALGEDMTVLAAGSRHLLVAHADEPLQEALHRMLRRDVGRVPVVSREDPGRLLGYLGRSALLKAHLQRLDEEQSLEPGWLAGIVTKN